MNQTKSTVRQMQESCAGEIIHLFEVMQKHNVKVSLELQAQGALDPLLAFSILPIDRVEYFESSTGPDSVIIEVGENSFCFELGANCFFKEISNNDIIVSVVSDHYTAWFNSGSIHPQGIDEAKNYKELPDPEDDCDSESIDIALTAEERLLVLTLRGLCFEDVLDATDGILKGADKATDICNTMLASGVKGKAEGFRTRSINLEHLAQVLGDANADYRAHINTEDGED